MKTELSRPRNSTMEVLYELIKFGQISYKDMFWMFGFRTRISDLSLKYGLYLEHKNLIGFNKFGNQYIYKLHILPESEKENAIKLYNHLDSNIKIK